MIRNVKSVDFVVALNPPTPVPPQPPCPAWNTIQRHRQVNSVLDIGDGLPAIATYESRLSFEAPPIAFLESDIRMEASAALELMALMDYAVQKGAMRQLHFVTPHTEQGRLALHLLVKVRLFGHCDWAARARALSCVRGCVRCVGVWKQPMTNLNPSRSTRAPGRGMWLQG